MVDFCIYEDRFFRVMVLEHPLNDREDGGHLILFKKDAVTDRSDLSFEEAIDFMRITMMVGRAMYDVLGVERINYEDNGNWGLDNPQGAELHLHFVGRAHEQRYQVRGQHFNLNWPKGHPIYGDGTFRTLADGEIDALRTSVANLTKEEKYRRMAELAGIGEAS